MLPNVNIISLSLSVCLSVSVSLSLINKNNKSRVILGYVENTTKQYSSFVGVSNLLHVLGPDLTDFPFGV